eukprot:363760-Chlamydomonas_euryale.AAC.5
MHMIRQRNLGSAPEGAQVEPWGGVWHGVGCRSHTPCPCPLVCMRPHAFPFLSLNLVVVAVGMSGMPELVHPAGEG